MKTRAEAVRIPLWNDRTDDPYIIVLKEKHGSQYFLIKTWSDFVNTIRCVFNERRADNYWYDEADISEVAHHIDRLKNKVFADGSQLMPEAAEMLALAGFLEGRSDHEYEGIYVEYLRRPQDVESPVFENTRDIIKL